MPQIGEFIATETGFSGRIRTLTLDSEITIIAVDASNAENAPDYRIHNGTDADGPEIGAGWKKTGERAGTFLSLLIGDPALPQPIRAHLFRNGGSAWSLHWSRLPKREGRG
ncbi:DUF736 domain-containing protein [Paracoccus onubensis]|uniref:DUF736 domain-containing protein n=1 Tax=Paracoccus onubensis TaxID=1675788 RepID=UPI0027321A80|nr:DUF736 domain-containing protein [Paracoccus onubensis]MDP0929710.1 DUF736 domain-containing protein [Paracoccus onubensis]